MRGFASITKENYYNLLPIARTIRSYELKARHDQNIEDEKYFKFISDGTLKTMPSYISTNLNHEEEVNQANKLHSEQPSTTGLSFFPQASQEVSKVQEVPRQSGFVINPIG
jgi:hypothetical protein